MGDVINIKPQKKGGWGALFFSFAALLVALGVAGMSLQGGEQAGMGGVTNLDALQLDNGGLTITSGNLAVTSGNLSLSSGSLSVTGAATVDRFTQGATMLATSTATAADVVLVADLIAYSGFDYTPGDLAVTLTLPATSTMTAFIPNAGDCADFRIRNLDATAATSTTIAAGTGIDLVENENGDVVIEGGNEAQLKFCRELDTDVTVYVDEYIAAD